MATDIFIGPQGGSWFDPANWSNGTIPASGDVAGLFQSTSTSNTGAPAGVDATASTVAGVTIDLSGSDGTSNDSLFEYPFAPDLTAATLGSPSAPVTLDVTADSGANSKAGLLVDTVYGSINVAAGQNLAVASYSGEGENTFGNISVGAGATFRFENDFVPFLFNDDHSVVLNGLTKVEGGTLDINAYKVSGAGSIEIGEGGTALFTATATQTIGIDVTFDSTGGTLNVDHIFGVYTGTITGFGTGDTIIASNEFASPPDPIATSYADGVLTISLGVEPSEQFHFAGDYTLANFDANFGGDGIEITYQPCFATGTRIVTPQGLHPVEQLAPGDQVTLADGGTAPIVWIGHRRQRNGKVVRIRAGALGHATPIRDLFVSTDHSLYLDGILIQAGLLVNGETILIESRDEVTFWHVELDRHTILLAEGAAAESYLDTGNRRQFANCHLAYDAACVMSEPCAEMVFAGEKLAAIRHALRAAPAAIEARPGP